MYTSAASLRIWIAHCAGGSSDAPAASSHALAVAIPARPCPASKPLTLRTSRVLRSKDRPISAAMPRSCFAPKVLPHVRPHGHCCRLHRSEPLHRIKRSPSGTQWRYSSKTSSCQSSNCLRYSGRACGCAVLTAVERAARARTGQSNSPAGRARPCVVPSAPVMIAQQCLAAWRLHSIGVASN
jgi:hypothetical protein